MKILLALLGLLLGGIAQAAAPTWTLAHRAKEDNLFYWYFGEAGGDFFALPGLSVSSDGGKTWSDRDMLGDYCSVAFATKDAAILAPCKFPNVDISTDGGRDVDAASFVPLPGDGLHPTVGFFDAKNGFGLSEETLLATHDGGRTWTVVPVPALPSKDIVNSPDERAVVVQGDRAWIAFGMKDARVLLTEDRGRTWSVASTLRHAEPQALCFSDARHGWLLTGRVGGAGLLSTSDGGKTWAEAGLDSARAVKVQSLACRDERSLWASGPGLTLASADGGATWSELPPPPVAEGSELRRVGLRYQRTAGSEALLLATWESKEVHEAGSSWKEDQGAIYRLVLPPAVKK